jgi:arylsulfatase A-like enzyme
LVLAKLKQLGLEENTFVIFTADHGETFGERFASAHKTVCYDDSAKVPLIFGWPSGLPSGQVYSGGVSTVDLMPTILEAAGIPIPPRAQGTSHLKDIRAGRLGWNEHVFIENITGTESASEASTGKVSKKRQLPGMDHEGVERAVRTRDWKLILREPVRDELYDLANDPAERIDLFHNPAMKGRVSELSALIKNWGKKVDDQVAVTFGSRYA